VQPGQDATQGAHQWQANADDGLVYRDRGSQALHGGTHGVVGLVRGQVELQVPRGRRDGGEDAGLEGDHICSCVVLVWPKTNRKRAAMAQK
jgi:hypothetical protein